MKKILLLFLFLLVSLPAISAEWLKIGDNLFIDKSSVHYISKNRTYAAWVKEIKPKEVLLYYNEYDLKNNEWRPLDIVTLDSKNNIKKRETPNHVGMTWLNVVPDTNSAFEFSAIKKQIQKPLDVLEKELHID